MKFSIAMISISLLGIGGILYTTIMNAEVKGYTDVHGC